MSELDQIVRANAPGLLAYFERRLADPEDAADLLGETLLVVWRRLDALPTEPLEARMWMFGVARRVLSTARRGGIRRLALVDRLREELAADMVESKSADPRLDQLSAALATLSERDREIVRLLHWDGFSLADIAHHLRMRPGTVRSRYHRARSALRSHYNSATVPS